MLIVGAFAAIAWAFGWRVACVAATVFGCNPLASFLWTGGSYLRQDWLALAILGACLLRKGRPALGGAALAYSALLRIFPAAFLLPIAVRMAWIGWRERRLDRVGARVLAGAAIATIVLVVASSVATGGADAWLGFYRNTVRLTSTPSENLVGLPTILSFRPSTRAALLIDDTLPDPVLPVREARRANFASARPLYFIALAALFAALVRAVRRVHEPWNLVCLGAAAVPLATEMSCYYSSLVIVVVLLVRERPRVGLALLLLCGALLALQFGPAGDVLYVCSSLALVATAAWILWDAGSVTPVAERHLTPLPDGNGRASTFRQSRHARVLGAIAASVAIVASLRWPDSLMAKDRTCEDRWVDLVAALRVRANLAPPSLETRKKAMTIHPIGEDFADPAKIAAFERAQAELREAIGGADDPRAEARVDHARDAYNDAVTDFDRALEKAPGAIDRATGRPLLPRVPIPREAL